jgi:hypothetical protein
LIVRILISMASRSSSGNFAPNYATPMDLVRLIGFIDLAGRNADVAIRIIPPFNSDAGMKRLHCHLGGVDRGAGLILPTDGAIVIRRREWLHNVDKIISH